MILSYSLPLPFADQSSSLAYMELFLTVAAFVRRFNLELVDTTPDDVRVVREYMVGFTKKGNVKVNGRLSLVDEYM